MRTSDALDLERGVFTKRSPRAVARSLKRSAERSRRRKSAPFRSAMSMLNFHTRSSASRGAPPHTAPSRARRIARRGGADAHYICTREPSSTTWFAGMLK